VAPILLIFRPE